VDREFLRPQWIRGSTSRQAHADLPPGTVEEEHGREGFAGAASHLYRLHPPTGWTSLVGPLRPHALDTAKLNDDEAATDALPTSLLHNEDCVIAYWRRPAGTPPWFYRNAEGDTCYFVHVGHGTLGTEYGPLGYREGDFLVVPRGTTHRFEAEAATELLTVVALGGSIQLPDRGMLGRHALFDPAIIDVPEPEPHDEPGEFEVRVRRDGEMSTITYPFHPFDVVGWKGDLAPMRLNVEDFRPVSSARYHVPPSAHTTFAGAGFVIATFAPRPFESDPAVLRVPFYHRNIDYDEVIFYHAGQFFSRAGIGAGMLTFHPVGIHHGPQPAAVERAEQRGPGGETNEVAINIDARRPLRLAPAGDAIEVGGYADSWRPPDRGAR
jgi:homogentisate 1,2-dioxygenase